MLCIEASAVLLFVHSGQFFFNLSGNSISGHSSMCKIADPFVAATCSFALQVTYKGYISAYFVSSLVPDLWNRFKKVWCCARWRLFIYLSNTTEADVIILHSKLATWLHPWKIAPKKKCRWDRHSCTDCWKSINIINNSWICIKLYTCE